LFGIHWVLANVPPEITFFALFFFCVGILHLGRWKYENLPYNISMASEIGDVALICAIMVATRILQRSEGVWASMETWKFLWHSVLGSVSFGLIYGLISINPRGNTKMDTFHNRFIAPLLFLLLWSSLPVVVRHGTKEDQWAFSAFFCIWLGFLVYDAVTGRLNQPKWMAKRGIKLPIDLPYDEDWRNQPRPRYGD
jgi:hypothetical protein